MMLSFLFYGEADPSLFPPNVDLIQGDLTDFKKTYESTRGCNGIIHLALVSDGGTELDHQRVTVGSTKNLFLAALEDKNCPGIKYYHLRRQLG